MITTLFFAIFCSNTPPHTAKIKPVTEKEPTTTPHEPKLFSVTVRTLSNAVFPLMLSGNETAGEIAKMVGGTYLVSGEVRIPSDVPIGKYSFPLDSKHSDPHWTKMLRKVYVVNNPPEE